MDCVKMDDPRLDESFSLLFVFKKGDTVARKDDPSLRGEDTRRRLCGRISQSRSRKNQFSRQDIVRSGNFQRCALRR